MANQNKTYIRGIGKCPIIQTQDGTIEGHYALRAVGFANKGVRNTGSTNVTDVSVKVQGHPEIIQAFGLAPDQDGSWWLNAALFGKDCDAAIAAAATHEKKCVRLELSGALYVNAYTKRDGTESAQMAMNVALCNVSPVRQQGQGVPAGVPTGVPTGVPAAPVYAAPAPAAPQYAAPAPAAPQYAAPAPAAPQYSAPAPAAPQYTAPAPAAPQYSAPAPAAPQYTAPAPQGSQQPVQSAPAPAPAPAPVYQPGQNVQDYDILDDDDRDLPF